MEKYGEMLYAAIYGQQGLVGPPHFHYVAPSFWAWKGGEERLKGLSGFVDHVFCILPFESEVCISKGLSATFVGHPTLEDVFEQEVNQNVYGVCLVLNTGVLFHRRLFLLEIKFVYCLGIT